MVTGLVINCSKTSPAKRWGIMMMTAILLALMELSLQFLYAKPNLYWRQHFCLLEGTLDATANTKHPISVFLRLHSSCFFIPTYAITNDAIVSTKVGLDWRARNNSRLKIMATMAFIRYRWPCRSNFCNVDLLPLLLACIFFKFL